MLIRKNVLLPNSYQIAQLWCLCGVDPAASSSGTNIIAGSTTDNNSNDSKRRQFNSIQIRIASLRLSLGYKEQ